MKKIERYACEICGTEYTDKLKCQKCEKGHKIPASVVGGRWLPVSNDASGEPITVCVTFTDGSKARYKKC